MIFSGREDRLPPGICFPLSEGRVPPENFWVFVFGFSTSSDGALLEPHIGFFHRVFPPAPPIGFDGSPVRLPASTLGLWLRDASGPQYHPGPAGATPPSPSSAYRSLPFGRSLRPEGLASDTGRYLKIGLFSCQVSGYQYDCESYLYRSCCFI